MSYLENSRSHWTCAQNYPITKEEVYPQHAEANEFDRAKGKGVLEYGCGGGADTLSYLRRGAGVIFCDIVPGNVALTTERVRAAGHSEGMARGIVLENTTPIPVGDAAVDIVSCVGVYHHIATENSVTHVRGELPAAPLLREFHRVLKPGGRLTLMVYTEYLEAKCSKIMADIMAANPGMTREQAFGGMTDGSGCPYARSYTVEQGEAMLRANGFKVVSTMEYNDRDFRTFRAVRP
jgi:SAM-dependent methyltransferase